MNIGSGGALFTVDQPARRGQRVELQIAWPVLLHDKVHLNLVAEGLIVRVEESRAAMKFERCSFRTTRAAFRQQAQAPEIAGRLAESHG